MLLLTWQYFFTEIIIPIMIYQRFDINSISVVMAIHQLLSIKLSLKMFLNLTTLPYIEHLQSGSYCGHTPSWNLSWTDWLTLICFSLVTRAVWWVFSLHVEERDTKNPCNTVICKSSGFMRSLTFSLSTSNKSVKVQYERADMK